MTREEPGDAISRGELLKAIDTWDKFGCDVNTRLVRYQDHFIPYIHYDDVIKCIKGMPSVKVLDRDSVLDKVRSDIEMYEADCRLQGGTDECEKCNSNVFGSIYRIIDKYKESEETETWNGMHGQITAPKGTFEKIFNDTEGGDDI